MEQINLTKKQTFIIALGYTGVCVNFAGIVTHNLSLNLAGILIARASGALYNNELGRLNLVVTSVPLMFGVLSVVFNNVTLTFCELASQALIYQITAKTVFINLNTLKGQTSNEN